MIDATVTTVAGVLIWYAIKYFLLGEYATYNGMQMLIRHVKVMVAPVLYTTYSIVLTIWTSGDKMCSGNHRKLALTLVVASCVAFAMHVIAIHFPAACSWVFSIGHTELQLSPVNAAVFVVLLHTAIAGARDFPGTVCTSIITITPVWTAAACLLILMRVPHAQPKKYFYYRKKKGSPP